MNVAAPQDQSLNRSHGAVGHIGDDATHEGDVVFVKGLPDFTGTGPLCHRATVLPGAERRAADRALQLPGHVPLRAEFRLQPADEVTREVLVAVVIDVDARVGVPVTDLPPLIDLGSRGVAHGDL